MASRAAALVDAWLRSSRDGYCAATEGEGDCARGDKGSFGLPVVPNAHWSWRPAIAFCLARCSACARCSYVTVSLADHDCSWYHTCDLSHLHTDLGQKRFHSGGVPRRRLANVNLTAELPRPQGAFTEEELVAQTYELQQPATRRALHRWIDHSIEGRACGPTTTDDEGDCEGGDRGVFELQPCESRAPAAALANCLARCAHCSRCRYISLSPSECEWFHECAPLQSQSALEMRPGEIRHASQPIRLAGTRTGPAGLPLHPPASSGRPSRSWSMLLPHTWRMADPRRTQMHGATSSIPSLTPPHKPPNVHRLRWKRRRGGGGGGGREEGGDEGGERCATVDDSSASRSLMVASVGGSRRLACSEQAMSDSGAWLVVGIMSGVRSIDMRDAIRSSWLQAGGFSTSAVGCFVLAARGLLSEWSGGQREAAEHHDVLWLANATEGCAGMTFSKTYEFWRWSANLPPSVTHIVKTEDDVVLHLPNLVRTLRPWARVPSLYLGGFAHAGYDMSNLRMCGFDWGGGGGNFRRYGCVGYPAVPFAQGPLEVVSANLARRIARDPAISAFVAHARTHGGSGGRAAEDVLLGVWVSHVRAVEPREEVKYVAVELNSLADLHCGGNVNQLMSTAPSRAQLLVHRLKTPQTTAYVWDVLSCRVEHTRDLCARRVCRGKGGGACAADA